MPDRIHAIVRVRPLVPGDAPGGLEATPAAPPALARVDAPCEHFGTLGGRFAFDDAFGARASTADVHAACARHADVRR